VRMTHHMDSPDGHVFDGDKHVPLRRGGFARKLLQQPSKR